MSPIFPDHPLRPSLSDEEAIRGVRAGDPAVLRALMRRHTPTLERFAARMLGDEGDPQDVVQEAFIRLWTRRERWNPGGSLAALLFTLTRNAAVDELRRCRYRPRRSPLTEASAASPGPSPFDDTWSGDLCRRAQDAVCALPPRRQEVFRLVREGGLTYSEVARFLELSPQTVANHMSLALADLRKALGPVLGLGEESGEHEPASIPIPAVVGSD